jgi:hypothetical protein
VCEVLETVTFEGVSFGLSGPDAGGTMRFGNVDGVPTLVKIGTTVRGIASLNDAGIKDDVLFKHLIEA